MKINEVVGVNAEKAVADNLKRNAARMKQQAIVALAKVKQKKQHNN